MKVIFENLFTLTKPNDAQIAGFITASKDGAFSYRDVGASRDLDDRSDDLKAYNVDHNRVLIGDGEHDFEKAKQAIREWKMFDFDWVELCWPDTSIETGQTVAVLIKHFGLYSLNAARIVYTIDEPDRFGFAYGTLEDHGESGEERFIVERDSDGKVWYDLKAFSKPNHALAKLGYPFVRMLQKRFGQDSKQAMFRAVNSIG